MIHNWTMLFAALLMFIAAGEAASKASLATAGLFVCYGVANLILSMIKG